LQGFTSQVFDIQTGYLLDNPSWVAIYSIRQICNLMSKVELPCSDAREKAAFSQYVETDQEVQLFERTVTRQLVEEYTEVSKLLWTDIFCQIDESIFNGDIVPKHGPGATADRISGNAKFRQQVWTQRLEEVFPHGEMLFPNWRHYDAERVTLLTPETEMPVRVISVPKTHKTPRIIAIEPLCVQYVQQGLMERLVDLIEGHDYLSVIVGFRDQLLNQQMAKKGSRDGSLATLDLSEASDRVSWLLVQKLVEGRPWLCQGLDSTRTRQADVPGHGVISLSKYASMGSGLCFPIEAMVFTTIVFMAIGRARGKPVRQKDLKSFCGRVRIYGDDIIVPVEYVQSVVELLEAFGLKVNSHKSFWTGKFRESCGKEYYDDHDVSIVKVRKAFPTQRRHAREISSIVSLRNQLFEAGFTESVEWLDSQIERLIPFPEVHPTSPGLGKFTHGPIQGQRECPTLQRPLVMAAKMSDTLPPSPLGDDAALLKFFLKRGDEPYAKDHLRRAGRPDAVTLKLGWVSIY